MDRQSGFTLFELMIAIVVIAILTAIGLPAYQGYVKKAALTDMLQLMTAYKTAIEICVAEQGALNKCSSGENGVPFTRSTNYVTSISVTNGVIYYRWKKCVIEFNHNINTKVELIVR